MKYTNAVVTGSNTSGTITAILNLVTIAGACCCRCRRYSVAAIFKTFTIVGRCKVHGCDAHIHAFCIACLTILLHYCVCVKVWKLSSTAAVPIICTTILALMLMVVFLECYVMLLCSFYRHFPISQVTVALNTRLGRRKMSALRIVVCSD